MVKPHVHDESGGHERQFVGFHKLTFVATVGPSRPIASLVATALILTGCWVQSIHPFYTEASRIAVPELVGEWQLVRSGDGDLSAHNVKPWSVHDLDKKTYGLITHNEDNVSSNIRAVFFQVDGHTFCDWTAGNLEDERAANEYWLLTIRAVHVVHKVEHSKDSLTFTPLHAEWVSKAIEAGEITIPFLKPRKTEGDGDDLPIYTATSEDWEKLLKQHATNTNAFQASTAIVLKRKAPEAKPAQTATPAEGDKQ